MFRFPLGRACRRLTLTAALLGTPDQQAQEIADNVFATRNALFDEASATLAKGQFVFQSSALTGTPHQHGDRSNQASDF